MYGPPTGHPLGYDGSTFFVFLILDLRTDFLLSLAVLVREADFAVTFRVLLVEVLLSNLCFF